MTPENSWLQRTLINRSSPNASIPTLKPSITQGPASSRARHTMQIIQQHRNIALSFNIQAVQSHIKPTDISKLTTGHLIALQREEIQLHPPEHPHKLPWPGNLDKPPVQPHLQWGNSTIKRTPQTARIQKGHPKHSNINRMKTQKNTQQVLQEGITGQTQWNHNHRKLVNLITRTTALSNSM